MKFNPGDKVECVLTHDQQNAFRSRDDRKAKELGKKPGTFMGHAAAYMHTDHAYVVEGVTETGGLRLLGFVPTVSPNDVQHSTKSVDR